MGRQESGITSSGQREPTIDEELENWDENAADDWDEEEVPQQANGAITLSEAKSVPAPASLDTAMNKRAD